MIRRAPATVMIGAIRLYQSWHLGRPSPCRFIPSCSQYALEAVESFGAVRGSWLAFHRLLRCRPHGGHGFDPIPSSDCTVFASTIGQIGHPFYIAFAWVLAEIYSAIPNYAVAIALLTVAVMVVVFPVMLKGTRGMMKMQLLAPELKKIQDRHKVRPGMSVEERQEARRALNEEMMAMYKENGTSPTGGCLPQFLQMPMFLILYGTIRGLVHTTPIKEAGGKIFNKPTPLYISSHSRLYENIQASKGVLKSFGINMADSVRTPGSWGTKLPFIALILVAIGLQYLQMKQLSGRNPAARQANPQMQQMQKIFPLIFAFIYISIPAGVNVYFIVSSLFRVGAQEAMYRRDPELQAALHQLRTRHAGASKVIDAKTTTPAPGGRFGKFRAAVGGQQLVESSEAPDPPKPAPKGYTPPRSSAARPGGAQSQRNGQAAKNGQRPPQPRAAGKRPRRPR